MRLALLPLLFACHDTKDGAGEEEEFVAPLAAPYLGMYAAASAGTFRSDCLMEVDLNAADGTPVDSAVFYPIGGEWAGLAIDPGVQYTALLSWDSCTTGPEGTGTFEASVFSGVEGDFFLFHYNGVAAAFEALAQEDDFDGGIADVTYEEGTESYTVQEIAVDNHVTADETSDTAYHLTWKDTKPIGEVLGMFTDINGYVSGAPSWVHTPDWW